MEEESGKRESRLTSAAAFVEGGIQDACDDSCSICLEDFCDSNPSAVTNCKHEFHLQCILEWCQRSSECPMCLQAISMKDPISQELFEGVECERNLRLSQSRNTAVFHHPALGNFELQHLPLGANDSELEERIFQHLAAAAAIGRAQHIVRREGLRTRSGARVRPQYMVSSSNLSSGSAASSERGENEIAAANAHNGSSISNTPGMRPVQPTRVASMPSGGSTAASNRIVSNMNSTSQSTVERAGPSDLQSFSESLKSRFNSFSMRYRESITNSTRGWKERFFTCNTSMSELRSDVRREVNAGLATVSRMIERLDTRDNIRAAVASASQTNSVHINQNIDSIPDNPPNTLPTSSSAPACCAASSSGPS